MRFVASLSFVASLAACAGDDGTGGLDAGQRDATTMAPDVRAAVDGTVEADVAAPRDGGPLVDRALEGFGAASAGGAGGAPCVVESLADSGSGTLRDCLSASSRLVTFTVGGTIELATSIRIDGLDHITIDGSTAPAPGITVTAGPAGVENALFIVTGTSHDLVVRHLRFADATDVETGDTFRLYDGSHDIVIDHCSFRRGADGGLDISQGVHDVTVQWSSIAETVKHPLMSYTVANVSLHHNLYAHGDERNPQLDTTTTADLVNNVIYDWGGNYGTRIRDMSSANLIANVYRAGPRSDAADAVVIDATTGAQVYSEGNDLPAGADATGNLSARIPAPPVTELATAEAYEAVLAEAGAFPRDADDQRYVDDVRNGL